MSDMHPATPMGEPVTASRPATPAMTPGQAAYEAAMRSIAEQTGLSIDFRALEPMIAWDEQTETARAAWHASAEAVAAPLREEADAHASDAKAVRAHLKVVTAERDRLEGERDQLQAAHNALSVKNAELADQLAQHGRDFTIVERDRTRLSVQNQELESVIREMLAHWERIGTTREDDELITGWCERAGIEVEG